MRNDASLTAFRAARDLLLNHREDYDAAVAEFSWPKLGEFNWALDWFDQIAAEHPDRIALRVVGDDGSDEVMAYGRMAVRSSQVANWLRTGELKSRQTVVGGLENAVDAFLGLLAGANVGKMLVRLSDDDAATS